MFAAQFARRIANIHTCGELPIHSENLFGRAISDTMSHQMMARA
jgi:hypothetical protein